MPAPMSDHTNDLHPLGLIRRFPEKVEPVLDQHWGDGLDHLADRRECVFSLLELDFFVASDDHWKLFFHRGHGVVERPLRSALLPPVLDVEELVQRLRPWGLLHRLLH